MGAKPLILPAAAVILAAALLMLVVKVRAKPEIAVDSDKLAAAEARYKRSAPSARTTSLPSAQRNSAVAGAARPRETDAPERPRPRAAAAIEIESDDAPRPEIIETPKSLQDRMRGANELYDRADYPGAEEAAMEILREQPRNIRMLRIVVSTSCITGNRDQAREYYGKLPARDQSDMRKRCASWGLKVDDNEE